jgi:chemotaxis protein CheC
MIPTNDVGLTELESDALVELVNMGVGRSALNLRELVGEQVFLSVPSLSVLTRAEAAAQLNERNSYLLVAVRQSFDGDFSGRALLIFHETNSLELVRAVAGKTLSIEDIIELEQEALAEIGNIILNGCMATVANLLERTLTMSMPEVLRGTGSDFFDLNSSSEDDVVVFVQIHFSLKGKEINGYVAMVMDLVSLSSLKSLVADYIKRAAM